MAPILKSRHIVVLSANRQYGADKWERNKLKQWITSAGGELESNFTSRTTHVVVCDQEIWDAQGADIRQAIDSANRKIHVVTFKWLYDTLHEQAKVKTQHYQWEARPQLPLIRQSTANDDHGQQVEVVDNVADVFIAGTKDYVNPEDEQDLQRSLVEQHIQGDGDEERQQKRWEEQKRRLERKKWSAKLRREAMKPLNERFAGHHHVFRSHTDFAYQVTLTKIDLPNNCNARIVLTIYESNSSPNTYAVNMHSAASDTTPENTVFVSEEANFLTAFRLFSKAFREKTKVSWDERLDAFEQGSEHMARVQEMSFQDRPYTYYIPAYGPTDRIETSTSDMNLGANMLGGRVWTASDGPHQEVLDLTALE